MRLILTTLAGAVLALSPAFTTEAAAHGGAYRGPAGEVPPDSREPFDPPPPPEGGGPTTPGGETGGPTTGDGVGGTPSTGGGEGGTPSTGGGSTGPTSPGGGTGGPKTGQAGRAGGASKGPGYEDWTFWWNFNKDEILQLKSKTRRVSTATGTAVHALGRGRSAGRVKTATDAVIQNDVVPALHTLLADDDAIFDIRSAAALALAKIGDVRIVPTLERMARNEDGSYHREVEETAALALGVLQSDTPHVRGLLIELMTDTSKKGSYVRPFAAVSLGLLGSDGDGFQRSFDALLSIVAADEKSAEVKPAALLAIGLLEDERAVPDLLYMLENERANARRADKLGEVELAFAVEALGRIGAPGVADDTDVLDAVLGVLGPKGKSKAPVHVRRSAVIALGRLAPQCDAADVGRLVSRLKAVIRAESDASEQAFAMIALGRIAAVEHLDAKLHRDLVRALGHHLEKSRQATLLEPYAALALALAGAGSNPDEERICMPIRRKFAEGRGPARSRSAYAIASGIVRDAQAAPQLIDVVGKPNEDKRLRGYASIALGLIGGDAARESVREALTSDEDRTLRKQTAIAAGLMGDARVIEDLVAILESGDESQYVMGSVALALGQVGDEKAVAPLLAIALDEDKKHPELTRAFATVALGQIGDRRDLPVLARVGRDLNFRLLGGVKSLGELLSIL